MAVSGTGEGDVVPAMGDVTVLLVDDDTQFLDLASRQLEHADDSLDVRTVADPVTALDVLEDGAFDCVVSDYRMPEMEGLELLRTVREERPGFPFLLFTGKGNEEVAGEAISAGVTDYFRKGAGPDQFAVLANRITHAVAERRAERRAAESARRIRQVHERTADAVVAFDHDWRYTYLNGRAERLLDRPEEALLGERLWAVFPDLEGSRFEDRLRAAMRTGEPTTVEAYFEPLETWFETRAFPDEDGLSVYFRDVSERREREQQLGRERELERKDERLEEFASIVSHDLRNPLNIVAGNIDLVRETGDRSYLDDAEAALARMDRLVDDLLALAERGRLASDLSPVPLEAAVEEVTADGFDDEAAGDETPGEFDEEAAGGVDDETAGEFEDVTVVVECEANCRVRAERSRLIELLDNLLSNAVVHGGTEIRVGLAGDRLYVADDGPGIPPEERERVFEPGYSTGEDGTGFGLSIVRRLAEAQGWDVTVTESEAGGARFEVTDVDRV